jgi:hypothetical protein
MRKACWTLDPSVRLSNRSGFQITCQDVHSIPAIREMNTLNLLDEDDILNSIDQQLNVACAKPLTALIVVMKLMLITGLKMIAFSTHFMRW